MKQKEKKKYFPFSFPIAFFGLVHGHTYIKMSASRTFCYILYGKDGLYKEEKSEASKIANGQKPLTSPIREYYCNLDLNHKIQYIKDMKIVDGQRIVSIFYALLSSKDSAISISDGILAELSQVIQTNDDPDVYIQKAIELSMVLAVDRFEKENIAEIKELFSELYKTTDYKNLYAISNAEKYLSTASTQALDVFAKDLMPLVMKNICEIMLPGAITDEKSRSLIDCSDYNGLIVHLAQKGIISPLEASKWLRRRIPISEKAHELLCSSTENGEEKKIPRENVQSDWLLHFYELSGNISNEQLQDLWAKILAGELSSTSNISIRTLDVLSKITPEDAKHFEQIIPAVFANLDKQKIVYGLLDVNKYGRDLQECGLLSPEETISISFYSRNDELWFSPILFDRNEYCLFLFPQEQDNPKQSYTARYLTRAGTELYKLISKGRKIPESTTELCKACFLFAEMGWDARIYHVLNITETGFVEYDPSCDFYEKYLECIGCKKGDSLQILTKMI